MNLLPSSLNPLQAPDLDLDLIRCFLAVAESGGFTAASSRLHLSQSAVTLKIKRLESILGKEVFTRSSRTISLTAEGTVLLNYGRRLLALNQEMFDSISHTQYAAHLRLGVMQQFGEHFLSDLLTEFKTLHPQVQLSVEVGMTGDLIAQLEQGSLDLVLGVAGSAQESFIHEQPLHLKEEIVWTRSSTSAIDLSRDPLPLVLFPEPCRYRKNALAKLQQAGRTWKVAYTSSNPQAVHAAITADIGIGALSRRSVSITPGVQIIDASATLPPLPDISTSLYRHTTATSHLIHALSDSVARLVNLSAAQVA